MSSNLQLQRQAVSHKAILDFTIGRIPQIPESLVSRFPDLRNTSQEMDQFRINLQLQLREQFVAIREMLNNVPDNEDVEAINKTLLVEIQRIQNNITTLQTVTNIGSNSESATSDALGLVKTDITESSPVVYLKTTIDKLLSAISVSNSSSISSIISSVNELTNIVNGVLAGSLDESRYQTFAVAASVWTWNHNFGYRPAAAQAYDSSWNLMITDINHVSVNQLTATHLYNATGYLMAD